MSKYPPNRDRNLLIALAFVQIPPVSGQKSTHSTSVCPNTPCIGTEIYSWHWRLSRYPPNRDRNSLIALAFVQIHPESGQKFTHSTSVCPDSPCIGTEIYSWHWRLSRYPLNQDRNLLIALAFVPIPPVSGQKSTYGTGVCPDTLLIETGILRIRKFWPKIQRIYQLQLKVYHSTRIDIPQRQKSAALVVATLHIIHD